jgi:hypothetical protein
VPISERDYMTSPYEDDEIAALGYDDITVVRLVEPGERLWLALSVVAIGILLAAIVAAAWGWLAAGVVLGVGVVVALKRAAA